MTEYWKIGDATVYRLVETEDAGDIIRHIVREMTAEALCAIPGMVPRYVHADGSITAPVQSFLLKAGGRQILVDACSGNQKPRIGRWGNLHTYFLERLSAIVSPEAVDHVLCTHFHSDHIGWNTVWQDGCWTPTFPNARYGFSAAEVARVRAVMPRCKPTDCAPIEDSILPVIDAGLADLLADDAAVTPEVSFVPLPGHTPHHVGVKLSSKGENVLFCGDLIYHISQIIHPEWGTKGTDSEFYKTRIAVLSEAAEQGTLLFLGHADTPFAIRRTADGFAADPIAPDGVL